MPRAGRYGSYLPTKPLDLRVNGTATKFLEAKFTERFAKKIDEGLQEGKELEDIEVKFKLTTLKPLYTSWVWDSYDYLTSSKGEVIIKNQRKRAGIIEAVEKGFSELPPLGPFQSIDPIADQADIFLTQDTTSIYSSLDSCKDIPEWCANQKMKENGSIQNLNETFLNCLKTMKMSKDCFVFIT